LERVLQKPIVQVTLPTNMVDSPAIRWHETLMPKSPYRIKPGDLLFIDATDTLPNSPIRGEYLVEPTGTVALGPRYGRAKVQCLTPLEAEAAVRKKLNEMLHYPDVTVTLAGWEGEGLTFGRPAPIAATPERPAADQSPALPLPLDAISDGPMQRLSRPTVVVEATYPDAAADVITDSVAAPIEQQVNGMEQMEHMRSQSAKGTYRLQVMFNRQVGLVAARAIVESRVKLALPMLPDAVRQASVKVKEERAVATGREAEEGPVVDFVLCGASNDKVRQWASELVKRLRASKKLVDIRIVPDPAQQHSVPHIDVDRKKLRSLGISIEDLLERVAPDGKSVLASKSTADIGKLTVRNAKGEMVPLSRFTTVRETMTPDRVDRFDMHPSVEITANAGPGVQASQARSLCREMVGVSLAEYGAQGLPSGVRVLWLLEPAQGGARAP
ncbi:MAG: efflux RND transporter permease subunit, partial [Planctomycetaceae bacterium]|nr:efflux RND transporter permease subunit [Planctomycetaceae bacterium]